MREACCGRTGLQEQKTGDAEADGSVKVSYPASGKVGSEPVHVLAERAELKHDAGWRSFMERRASRRGCGRGRRRWRLR